MAFLKRAALRLFHSAGGLNAVRFRHRNGLRILMYHRFPGDSGTLERQLSRQCVHLKENYRVLSLTEASRYLVNREPLPSNAIVLTVDDGHRDFYTGAFPVLARYGMPVTVYVTTDYLDGRSWLWFDLIDFLFDQTRLQAVVLPGSNARLSLSTEADRRASAEVCKQMGLSVSHEDRNRLIEELPALLKVEVPGCIPEAWAPMTWDEAREMSTQGIEFGAHTRTHPILTKLPTDELMRSEIEGSKKRIEEQLSSQVAHFCYPNGSRADYVGVIDHVRQAGFVTAVTSEAGVNRLGTPLLELMRIGAEPGLDPLYFQRRVAGIEFT